MRRVKRDRQDRAFAHGYAAGLGGKSRDECPHARDDLRVTWLNGWRSGREDHHDGLGGVRAVHRMVPNGLQGI